MRKEGLSDAGLVIAVTKMEEGKIDANLGGKVFKKRVAFPGRGKRGGARTLIAYQDGENAFFMFGFSKNERARIDAVELKALKLMVLKIEKNKKKTVRTKEQRYKLHNNQK